jgi:hypothetical protein
MNSRNIKSIKKQIQLQDWALQVKEQQESGLRVSEWCRLKGIKAATYYHRLNRVRETVIEGMQENQGMNPLIIAPTKFAEVDIAMLSKDKTENMLTNTPAKISVYLNGITIEIPSNTPAESIAAVLNVVKAL